MILTYLIKLKNEEVKMNISDIFYYKKRKNALQAAEKIFHGYGEDALTRQTAANWFRRFRDGKDANGHIRIISNCNFILFDGTHNPLKLFVIQAIRC